MDRHSEDYQTALELISLLPASERRDFDQWLRTDPVSQNDVSKNDNQAVQLIIDFDAKRTPVISLPDIFSANESDTFHQLVNDTRSPRWGLLERNYLALRLDIPHGGQRGKLLVMHQLVVRKIIATLFPDSHLTPKEFRTLLQVVSGYNLKLAAQIDNVSYETKRSQFKAVRSKTSTSGQQELSNTLIAHLVLQVTAGQQPTASDTSKSFMEYLDTYFPASVKRHISVDRHGNTVRCIEFGDPLGLPVIFLHQLGALHYSPQVLHQAEQNSLRVLCPLRNGAVAPRDPELSVQEHIDHAVEGIHYALRLANAPAANILTGTSGCCYALALLERSPKMINQLIIFAASYRHNPGYHALNSWIAAGYRLAANNSVLFRTTAGFLRRSFQNPENLKRFYYRINRGSTPDHNLIGAIFENSDHAAAFQYRIINSMRSLLHDLYHQAKPDWSPLTRSDVPVSFIHGSDDRFHAISDIKYLTDQIQDATLYEVDDAGSWLLDNESVDLFGRVHKILSTTV